MSAANKLKIAVSLLKETMDYIPASEMQMRSGFIGIMQSIKDYMKSDEFKKAHTAETEAMSFSLLIDATQSCIPHLTAQHAMLMKKHSKSCSKKELVEKIIAELNNEDSEMFEKNINEWMDDNGYTIKKERKVRRKNAGKNSSSQRP